MTKVVGSRGAGSRFMSCAVLEPLEARVLMSASAAANLDYDLDFSTYLGGAGPDKVRAITVDDDGNLYVTGSTRTPGNFPTTPGAYDRTFAGVDDVFVAKLDPNGNVIWSTLIGGPNAERGAAIAVDDQGYVTIAGHAGDNFPVTAGAFQPTYQGYFNGSTTGFFKRQNAFVAKLSPDGSQLVFSSYSGTGFSHHGMDVDSNGDIYVGFEYSPGFSQSTPPASWFNGAYQSTPQGGTDTGIMKISSDGSQVLWATYFGGSGDENQSSSVRVADNGDVYLMSSTTSADLPTTPGAHDRTLSGTHDYYLARLTADGSNLAYGTYLGGSGAEFVGDNNLAIDSQGNAFVAAWSDSGNFPTTAGAFQTSIAGDLDGVVSKFSPTGQLLASTFFGGSGMELITGVDVDSAGRPVITGTTYSNNLPLSTDAHQATRAGAKDAFVAKFSADLSDLKYASYHGGSGQEEASPAASDSNGNLYFAGMTWSNDLPVTNATQPFSGGDRDIFLAKVSQTNSTGNAPPIADAGPDQTVQLSQGQTSITLVVDGSGSSDADGQIVAHRWTGTLNPPNVATFQATLGEGTYTFNLEVEDDAGATATDSITLTVLPPAPPNGPPVASDNAYNLFEDGVLQIDAATGVLANDSDPDGDPISALLVSGPLDGTLSLAADGSFTYTPDADFHGTDSFTYTAEDATATSSDATVTITVNPRNDDPDAGDDFYGVDQNGELQIDAVSGVLANDDDIDGDALISLLAGSPSHGTIALASDGSFTYTPNAGFIGSDSFKYRAHDGLAVSSEATVTIDVIAANNGSPNAQDDLYGVDQQSVLHRNALAGVLANDDDPDGDALSALLVSGPGNGTLALAADGSFTYTPDSGFSGSDSFVYRAHDGGLFSNDATVTINVTENDIVWETDFESGLPPGSSTDGDVQIADDGSGVNSAALLTEGSDAAFTQLVALPDNVHALSFDYRFSNGGDGDRIRVSIDGNIVFEQDGSEFTGNQFVSIDSIDLHAFAGQTVLLEFLLSTQGNANAALQVDNVTIVSEEHTSLFFQGNSTASYLDANGNIVTLSLKGPGTGEIVLTPQGLSDAIHILLNGTTDRSTVNLKTDGAATTVGKVTILNGSLKEFKAPTADLLRGFRATGTVTKMSWRDVAAGYTRIDVGGNAQSKAARYDFRNITDLDLETNSPVHDFTATRWVSSASTQNRFQSGAVRSLEVTNDVLDVTWDILGGARSIEIGGPVNNLNLKVAGKLGTLRLGDVADAVVDVSDSLGTVEAWRWLTGWLTAREAKWIRVSGDETTSTPGDFGANVTLNGPGFKNNWRALGNARIADTITGGTWRLAGPAKKITAGATSAGWSASIAGELKSLEATTGNLSGTVAAASIHQVVVERDLDGAMLLGGTNLGSDGLFGGTNANADSTQAGTIDVLKIGGAMRNSIVGAGWDSVNGIFNDGNDLIIGGSSSKVGAIVIGGLLEGVNVVGTGSLPKKLSINNQKLNPEGHPLFFTI